MEIIELRKQYNRITMFNNAAIFIVSYLIIFYLYQFFTLIPAFALQISNVFYTGTIDFDSVTSSSSSEVWQDNENIFAVFGTAPLVMIFFIILNIFAMTGAVHKLNYSLKVFCYWNIINGIIRFCGDFIFGHIFHLWSSNLVTDFLEVSYPSKVGALMCIIVALIIAFFCIRSTVRLVKYLFNPFMGGVKEKTLYNILYPVLIGVGFLYIFLCIPHFNKNEFGIFLLLALSAFLTYMLMQRKYRNIPEKRESLYIKLNRPLIVCVLIVPFVKIITDRGILISASAYRQQIIEMFIVIIFAIIFLIILISVIYYFYKQRKLRKQMRRDAQQMFKENNLDIDSNFWGVKDHDMDKYKDLL
ncbi:MAG: hypothetical protein LBO06_02910 [Bacteroidales bacterium]|jgi:hypothetical protein|nr:hypothetical protein [Bacteroidales bacterium]